MGLLSMDAPTPGGTDSVLIRRFKKGRWEHIEDTLSREEAVTVLWNDAVSGTEGTARLWAWPYHLEALALGHVLLDCLPDHAEGRDFLISPQGERQFSIALTRGSAKHRPPPPSVLAAPQLLEAMGAFIRADGLWEGTGCFHRAGVFSPAHNTLLTVAEDIGRHNCIDRLAGWSALTGTPLENTVLLTTARFTASLCAKALRAGFRVLMSRSAVTSAAVALAKEQGATLLGFTRPGEERLSVFTDVPERLGGHTAPNER